MKVSILKKYLFLAILGVICLAGTAIRYSVAVKHCFPGGDEGPWLRMTARVGTGEFLINNVIEHDFYKERVLPHPEDNRSPLFPILLKAGTLFTSDIFVAAQIVNLFLFLICLLISGIYLVKLLGYHSTVIFMLLVCISPVFIINTAHIYNDVTIAFCFFAGLFATEKVSSSKLRAFLTGSACGLFFLVKLSALFILPVVFLPFVSRIKSKKSTLLVSLLFILPFAILSVPWMVRNINHFGSPFHQFTGYVMWTDSMKEVFSVNIPIPSFKSYIDTHGLYFTLFVRPLYGFINILFQIVTNDHYLTPSILLFIPFGIYRTWKMTFLWRNIAVFSIPYLGLMSFVAYGFWVYRYLLVYYLLLYILAAVGIFSLSGMITSYLVKLRLRIFDRVHPIRPLIHGFILFLFFLLPLRMVIYPLEYYCSSRGSEYSRDKDARAIIAELKPIVADNESVLSSFLSGYSFLHNIRAVNTIHIGNSENFNLLKNSYNIQYALLDTYYDKEFIDSLPEWTNASPLNTIVTKGDFILYNLVTP